MPALMPFAWLADKIVDVGEVASGLSCGCTCLGCSQPVIARKGQKKIHHFSHYGTGACQGNAETGIHRKAKEILEKAGYMHLPRVLLPGTSIELAAPAIIRFDRVLVEKRMGRIQPDLVIETYNRELAVELAWKHFVEPDKKTAFQAMGLAALEIDLVGIMEKMQQKNKVFDSTVYRHLLVDDLSCKSWVYNPKADAEAKRLHQLSEAKKVKISQRNGFWQIRVDRCPEQKRTFNTDFASFYAQVFQDCLFCNYCSEIQYQKIYKGGVEVSGMPERVYCWAGSKQGSVVEKQD